MSHSDEATKDQPIKGGALGPDWSGGLDMKGQVHGSHNVHVQYKSEVRRDHRFYFILHILLAVSK